MLFEGFFCTTILIQTGVREPNHEIDHNVAEFWTVPEYIRIDSVWVIPLPAHFGIGDHYLTTLVEFRWKSFVGLRPQLHPHPLLRLNEHRQHLPIRALQNHFREPGVRSRAVLAEPTGRTQSMGRSPDPYGVKGRLL